jgi:class 3 adenylate cyclase/tetratricopeptide (TPR) repeat protein
MTCPKCSGAIPPQARFCPHCGSPQKPEAIASGGQESERKHVTIFFADLTDSLAHLEDLDPEDARGLLLGVLDLIIDAVRNSGGIVNQVMGDGVMAIFGAPVADEQHALNACIAATRIHEAVARYGHMINPDPGAEFRIRVGINSGEVVVGERGQGFDFQYSAFGEATHIAARVEQMARPGSSWITASTNALVSGQVRVEAKGHRQVRGLSRTVEVFELAGVRTARQKQRSSLGETPLVGRSDEHEALRACLWKASDGQGNAIILAGEPGVGKSRLTAEALAEAARDGWLVLEAGASPRFAQSNYFAVRDALQSYFMLKEGDDLHHRQRAIVQRLRCHDPSVSAEAALLSLFGISTPAWDSTPPNARRLQIIQALVWLTQAESRKQPVVWAIEDLQWADSGTEDFLAHLISAIGADRVLMLVNHRPEYRPSFASVEHCAVLPVNRLADQASRALLDEILGDDESLDPLKETLAEHTGGNPFFIEECVRALLEHGTLSGRFGEYRWTGELGRFIPTSVQDVLAARIDRLRPEEKHLLQSAAVIGYRVDALVLQRLTRLPDLVFRERITALCDSGFLNRTLQIAANAYQFVHILSHEVAYRGLLLQTRQQLHARVVDVLESELGERAIDQADVLANHALVGQQWDKAVHYFRAASRSALSQFACETAVLHCKEALNALDHLPECDSRNEAACDIRLELRNALFPLARHRDMLTYLKEANELSAALGDRPRQARVAAQLCHCYWLIGSWSDAVAAGERALALARPTDELSLHVWARFFKALAHYSLGEYDDAIHLLKRNAETLTGDLRHERLGGFTIPFVVGADWLACCLSERGEFMQAMEHAEAGLLAAQSAGYPFDRMHGLLGLAGVHLMRGTVADAEALLEQALALFSTTKVVSMRPRVLAHLGFVRAVSGRIGEALETAERATREAGNHGALRALCMRWRAEVLMIAGETEEALCTAREVLGIARETGQRGLAGWALRVVGEAQAMQGNSEAALASITEALDVARSLGMYPLVAHCHRALATLARVQGRYADAQRHTEEARNLYLELGMQGLPV